MLPEFLQGHPMWLVFVGLTFIAMARGQATYWLARVLTDQAAELADRRAADRRTSERGDETGPSGTGATQASAPRRGKLVAWLHGREVSRGARALRTWGLVAIPLGYLTVGFQTLVLAAAGVLRVPWPRFTIVQFPGALAWAGIYSTIGWALWEAAVAAVTGHPAGLIGLGALVLVIVTTTVINRRATARAGGPDAAQVRTEPLRAVPRSPDPPRPDTALADPAQPGGEDPPTWWGDRRGIRGA